MNDQSLDPQSRAILQYALETNDPWLARLVHRANAGKNIVDTFHSSQTDETNIQETQRREIGENDICEDKIEMLADNL